MNRKCSILFLVLFSLTAGAETRPQLPAVVFASDYVPVSEQEIRSFDEARLQEVLDMHLRTLARSRVEIKFYVRELHTLAEIQNFYVHTHPLTEELKSILRQHAEAMNSIHDRLLRNLDESVQLPLLQELLLINKILAKLPLLDSAIELSRLLLDAKAMRASLSEADRLGVLVSHAEMCIKNIKYHLNEKSAFARIVRNYDVLAEWMDWSGELRNRQITDLVNRTLTQATPGALTRAHLQFIEDMVARLPRYRRSYPGGQFVHSHSKADQLLAFRVNLWQANAKVCQQILFATEESEQNYGRYIN